MRGLLAKILLSMLISVTVALIVVFLITRVSLQRGLVSYIENQEAVQLQRIAPELAELYQQGGGWEFLGPSIALEPAIAFNPASSRYGSRCFQCSAPEAARAE